MNDRMRKVLSELFHDDGHLPGPAAIFVYGSNLAGRHGRGAAYVAMTQFDAVYGQGIGRAGQSYGIPTKDHRLEVLPIETISRHVTDFIAYARENPDLDFFVTRVGCGLAGYQDADIAPLFAGAPASCSFAEGWMPWLHPADRNKYCP